MTGAFEHAGRWLGEFDDKPGLLLPRSMQGDIANLIRTRVHEWAHYRQHVSTRFGALVTTIERMKADQLLRHASANQEATLGNLALRRRKIFDTPHDEATDALYTWHLLDRLARLLWKATMTGADIRNLVAALRLRWDPHPGFITSFNFADPRNLTGYFQPVTGGISVELVTEGHARFNELVALRSAFGPVLGSELWARDSRQIGIHTIRLIQRDLEVEAWHPIVGALHDMALATAPPASEQDCFQWEQHHPGIALVAAIATVDRTKLRGITPTEAYAIATEAASTTPADLSAAYENASRGSALRGRGPFGARWGPNYVFERGFMERARATEAVGWHREAGSWEGDMLVPYVLVQPSGVSFVGRWDHPLTASGILLDGMCALLTQDLETGCGMLRTLRALSGFPAEFAALIREKLLDALGTKFSQPLISSLRLELTVEGA